MRPPPETGSGPPPGPAATEQTRRQHSAGHDNGTAPGQQREIIARGFAGRIVTHIAPDISLTPDELRATPHQLTDVPRQRKPKCPICALRWGLREGTAISELQRRRYPADGDVERWVREGPPGHVNYLGGPVEW